MVTWCSLGDGARMQYPFEFNYMRQHIRGQLVKLLVFENNFYLWKASSSFEMPLRYLKKCFLKSWRVVLLWNLESSAISYSLISRGSDMRLMREHLAKYLIILNPFGLIRNISRVTQLPYIITFGFFILSHGAIFLLEIKYSDAFYHKLSALPIDRWPPLCLSLRWHLPFFCL